MRRVLIELAHPVLERSRVNRHLIEAVTGLDGVTVNDLYEVYPDLSIDVKREQTLLDDHDVIVFQHPFYGYTGPSILKECQDLVRDSYFARTRNAMVEAENLMRAEDPAVFVAHDAGWDNESLRADPVIDEAAVADKEPS